MKTCAISLPLTNVSSERTAERNTQKRATNLKNLDWQNLTKTMDVVKTVNTTTQEHASNP